MRLTIQQAYVILGVSSDASSDQVRQAYRKLALQFHPDKNPDPSATEKFQQLSAAYKRICDHQSRRGSSSNSNGHGHAHGDSDGFDFDDLYGDDDGDQDLDDMDISFDEMLMMFQMMFGHVTHGTKKKKNVKAKTTKKSSLGKAPPQVRVPTRRGGRKAPSRRGGGFMPSSMFGSAEEMMFQSFMTMEMAHEMNKMEKDFESMSSFFGSNFGDSDFSFGSDDDDESSELCGLMDFTASKDSKQAKSASHSKKSTVQEHGNQEEEEESSQETQETGEETLRASKRENNMMAKKESIELNAHVRVFGKHTGVVKFKGSVHYAKGDFLGVQLSEPLGKNDGTIKGVAYFECPAQHGLMVRPEDVALVA